MYFGVSRQQAESERRNLRVELGIKQHQAAPNAGFPKDPSTPREATGAGILGLGARTVVRPPHAADGFHMARVN